MNLTAEILEALIVEKHADVHTVAGYVELPVGSIVTEMTKMVRDGLIVALPNDHGHYEPTPAGLDVAKTAMMIAVGMEDPAVVERVKAMLAAEFDPEAAKQAIINEFERDALVASWLDDAEEDEMRSLLSTWLAENSGVLVDPLVKFLTDQNAKRPLKISDTFRVGRKQPPGTVEHIRVWVPNSEQPITASTRGARYVPHSKAKRDSMRRHPSASFGLRSRPGSRRSD